MVDQRKFTRPRRVHQLLRREEIEHDLHLRFESALLEHDPTTNRSAVNVIATLLALVGSQLLSQTQAGQRALVTLKGDIRDFGTEFVTRLMSEAKKDAAARLKPILAAPPVHAPLALADDWAGPVAGPTLVERYFGIPRSTLYRWQKLNEVVAIQTRSQKKPVFPLRQFKDGRPAEGIREVVQIFQDPREAWLWLVTPDPLAGKSCPLNALLEGDVDVVLQAAQASRSR